MDSLMERVEDHINEELLRSIYGGNGGSAENPFGSGATQNDGGG